MNQLAAETSPYLLQHAANPVHWRPWGASALQAAQQANKPILLSVGYAACHWCHVMAHESFENDAIAAVMNELFVSVKVDREERPDIDTIYQAALAMLGQQGGWPLTMFCTPQGDPFWGGTYFPPEPRYGHPGFPQLLRQVATLYTDQADKVAQNVDALRQALSQLSTPATGTDEITAATNDAAATRLLGAIDPHYGGIGDAPKFPQPSVLALLWRAYHRTKDDKYRAAVLLTLDHMAQGGIYDHLAGGYARYTVDRAWLVPHFEKMLYDNAQLIELYADAWRTTKNPLYAQRVDETITWLLTDMVSEPAGAYAASFDADSEGEEGRFYVWQAAEIDAALGPAAPLFRDHYDVSATGNWEGKTILNRSAKPQLADPDTEADLRRSRATLLTLRDKRVPPGRDDKILADWNGMMIAALAQASFAFDRTDWLAAAQRAYNFVTHNMQRDGNLLHSWRNDRLKHTALLDDYANMARAALLLFEHTANQSTLDQAIAWVATADRDYWAPTGGYFLTAEQADDVIVRTNTASDNAIPPGNAIMVEVLARLYFLTGTDRYRQRAEAVVTTFAGAIARSATGHTALLNAHEFLHTTTQVVIVGDPAAPGTQALRDVARRHDRPTRLVVQHQPAQNLPADHPAAGKGLSGDRPTAYVCQGQTCSPPVTDPADLATSLDRDHRP